MGSHTAIEGRSAYFGDSDRGFDRACAFRDERRRRQGWLRCVRDEAVSAGGSRRRDPARPRRQAWRRLNWISYERYPSTEKDDVPRSRLTGAAAPTISWFSPRFHPLRNPGESTML